MKHFRIAVLGGDGIGPDVCAEAVKVLQVVEKKMNGAALAFHDFPAGAGEYLQSGDPLPSRTFEACREHDAVLLGAMGLPDVRWPEGTEMAPQLDLRERLELYAGLRPIKLYNAGHSPLKSREAGEIDLLIVRENTEGLFWSRKGKVPIDADEVNDTLHISRKGAERVVRAAFQQATRRRNLLTLVDKANVLPSMVFFRRIFDEIAEEFPQVLTEKIYIDAAALYLVRRPHTFDVLLTENMFGDILSDLAAGLVGGMGMASSGDIGDRHAVFQPSHGSAPDIAGKGIANPVATILSAAMMLEWLNHPETLRGAQAIRQAVEQVMGDPANTTPDLGGGVTTSQMGNLIAAALQL